jgi:hypothetical protein
MSHLRLTSHVTVDTLLQFSIRIRLPLVLPKMFCPPMHQEYLHKAIGNFGVAIDSPPDTHHRDALRDITWAGAQRHHQPRSAHVLHEGANIGNKICDQQMAKDRNPKWPP